MSLYKLPFVLEPQPEGGHTITCPILPELITEADTIEEVSANVADALAVVIEIYEDAGRPLPDFLFPFFNDSQLVLEPIVSVAGK